jgi:hypothetical protein
VTASHSIFRAVQSVLFWRILPTCLLHTASLLLEPSLDSYLRNRPGRRRFNTFSTVASPIFRFFSETFGSSSLLPLENQCDNKCKTGPVLSRPFAFLPRELHTTITRIHQWLPADLLDIISRFSSKADEQAVVYSVTLLTLLIGAVLIYLANIRRHTSTARSNQTSKTPAEQYPRSSKSRSMSWSSRFGGWSGRFSPFSRNYSPSSAHVTDSDFSYITSDDLARNNVPSSGVSTPLSASGADDILIIKNRKVSYPIHFPANSIDSGEVTIGVLRIEAAKALGVKDARRVKLFYKGRSLKDDKLQARDAGFRSNLESEILCVMGEIGTESSYPDEQESADGAEDDSGDSSDSDDGSMQPSTNHSRKKRRNRRGKKKSKSTGANTPQQATSHSGHLPSRPSEYLPMPNAPHRPSSAPPTPAGPPVPASNDPLEQLTALSNHFHNTLLPLCEAFIAHPPTDKSKRDFEHKKLTETVLAQILLKLDAVETGGLEEARLKRKELVKESQGWLNRLDEVIK